jgi:hypothetical protein
VNQALEELDDLIEEFKLTFPQGEELTKSISSFDKAKTKAKD